MLRQFDSMSALKAGILGTVIMTIVMYTLPVIGIPPMDIMAVLGSVFPLAISPYILGFVIHFGIGIILAILYAVLFYSWLPGPGWVRGALFALIPWLYAITLLSPSLELAAKMMGSGPTQVATNPCAPKATVAAKAANPCTVVNPCAVKTQANPCAPQTANPCAVKPANPCAAKPMNPCAPGAVNPCAVPGNPCAAKPINPCAPAAINPCAPGAQAQSGIPPQVLSLVLHVIYGAVVGVFYRPRR